jgi:cysteine-rich repeat protein
VPGDSYWLYCLAASSVGGLKQDMSSVEDSKISFRTLTHKPEMRALNLLSLDKFSLKVSVQFDKPARFNCSIVLEVEATKESVAVALASPTNQPKWFKVASLEEKFGNEKNPNAADALKPFTPYVVVCRGEGYDEDENVWHQQNIDNVWSTRLNVKTKPLEDTSLQSVTATGCNLVPAYDPLVSAYLCLGDPQTSIVSAVLPTDRYSTYQCRVESRGQTKSATNWTSEGCGSIAVSGASGTSVQEAQIEVRAQSGKTSTYQVTVMSEAPLEIVSVSPQKVTADENGKEIIVKIRGDEARTKQFGNTGKDFAALSIADIQVDLLPLAAPQNVTHVKTSSETGISLEVTFKPIGVGKDNIVLVYVDGVPTVASTLGANLMSFGKPVVTGISPRMVSSSTGGQLTITGRNFGAIKYDGALQIVVQKSGALIPAPQVRQAFGTCDNLMVNFGHRYGTFWNGRYTLTRVSNENIYIRNGTKGEIGITKRNRAWTFYVQGTSLSAFVQASSRSPSSGLYKFTYKSEFNGTLPPFEDRARRLLPGTKDEVDRCRVSEWGLSLNEAVPEEDIAGLACGLKASVITPAYESPLASLNSHMQSLERKPRVLQECYDDDAAIASSDQAKENVPPVESCDDAVESWGQGACRVIAQVCQCACGGFDPDADLNAGETTEDVVVSIHCERCADGKHVGDEQCDDGNVISGDGCDAECSIEDGFDCFNGTEKSPDICQLKPGYVPQKRDEEENSRPNLCTNATYIDSTTVQCDLLPGRVTPLEIIISISNQDSDPKKNVVQYRAPSVIDVEIVLLDATGAVSSTGNSSRWLQQESELTEEVAVVQQTQQLHFKGEQAIEIHGSDFPDSPETMGLYVLLGDEVLCDSQDIVVVSSSLLRCVSTMPLNLEQLDGGSAFTVVIGELRSPGLQMADVGKSPMVTDKWGGQPRPMKFVQPKLLALSPLQFNDTDVKTLQLQMLDGGLEEHGEMIIDIGGHALCQVTTRSFELVFCNLGYVLASDESHKVTVKLGRIEMEESNITVKVDETFCFPGFHRVAREISQCVECEAGRYDPDRTSKMSCDLCPAGQYKENTGATACEYCPKYSSSVGDRNTISHCR